MNGETKKLHANRGISPVFFLTGNLNFIFIDHIIIFYIIFPYLVIEKSWAGWKKKLLL